MPKQKQKKLTAVIFKNDKNNNVVHVIHGDRIHQRVARWMKRNGLSMDNHDYYVTSD